MCHWLDLVAELVIRRIWVDHGARTPAVWLSWAVGMSASAARDQVRVALRLRELDLVRAEFAAGRISYSKVRALTRVAVPEIEEQLLQWAGWATGADMERIVAGFRTAQRGALTRASVAELLRDVALRDRGDGTSEVVFRLPTGDAHALYAAGDRLVDLDEADHDSDEVALDEGVSDDSAESYVGPAAASVDSAESDATVGAVQPQQRPRGARMADAVLHALQAAVAAGGADTSGADRDTLVVHVDADALTMPVTGDGTTDDGATGGEEAGDGQAVVVDAVSVDTAHGRVLALSRRMLRRMACEAAVVLVPEDADGTPMDVGRRTRRLSAALRRALLARDRSCRFPGCGARRHLHAHHIQHWADQGPTDLANLVLICSFHHRYVHTHEVDIRLRAERAHEFRHPDGRRIARSRPLPGAGPVGPSGQPWRVVDPDPTALEPTHWDGRFCLDTTVAVLQQQMRTVLPDADRTLAA